MKTYASVESGEKIKNLRLFLARPSAAYIRYLYDEKRESVQVMLVCGGLMERETFM